MHQHKEQKALKALHAIYREYEHLLLLVKEEKELLLSQDLDEERIKNLLEKKNLSLQRIKEGKKDIETLLQELDERQKNRMKRKFAKIQEDIKCEEKEAERVTKESLKQAGEKIRMIKKAFAFCKKYKVGKSHAFSFEKEV